MYKKHSNCKTRHSIYHSSHFHFQTHTQADGHQHTCTHPHPHVIPSPTNTWLLGSLVEAATSIISVVTKVLSWQAYFCHNKHVFVMTKHVFCHDKSMLVVPKIICCDKHNFVATSIFLLWQKTCPVFVATKLLSRQKWYLWQLPPVIALVPHDCTSATPTGTWSTKLPHSPPPPPPPTSPHFSEKWQIWCLGYTDSWSDLYSCWQRVGLKKNMLHLAFVKEGFEWTHKALGRQPYKICCG